mgnify:CR=1 FL=1
MVAPLRRNASTASTPSDDTKFCVTAMLSSRLTTECHLGYGIGRRHDSFGVLHKKQVNNQLALV